jgi:hypothetical protein
MWCRNQSKVFYTANKPLLAITKHSSRGRQYIIVKNYVHIAYDDGEFSFSVDIIPGFMTDGASLPRFARPFLNPIGDWFLAAVAHDWIYCMDSDNARLTHRKHGYRAISPCKNCKECNPKAMRHSPCDKVSRLLADKMFYSIMIQEGVNPILAVIFYLSVRLFGWIGWKKRASDVTAKKKSWFLWKT